MSSVVIELEGFQLRPDVFVIKELAFCDVQYGYHSRWSFLPPHPWELLSSKHKKTFSWLTRHGHRMQWDSGDLPYASLQYILTSLFVSYTHIYSKGLEKCKFIQNLCGRNILDLNDFKCPKVHEIQEVMMLSCPNHSPPFHHCALRKAVSYANFIKESLSSTGVIYAQDVDHRTPPTSEEMQN